MTGVGSSANRRIAAAFAALALEGLLGYALLIGLLVNRPRGPDESVIRLGVTAPEPPPPPAIVPVRLASRKPEGAASPPNLRARATSMVAPAPVLPALPSPVTAAPVAGRGGAPSSGAADVPGPGTGSGWWGTGTGGGRGGDGDGDGGGVHTPPRWLRGRLGNSDYPAEAGEAGAGGTVSVRFTVETTGRVGRCIVIASSGNGALDRATCRLIVERYRYRPSLDSRGRPVRSQVEEDHSWVTEIEEGPRRGSRRRY